MSYAPVDVEGEVVRLLEGATIRREGVNVRVTRAGGGQVNLAQSVVRLLIECWGADDVAAFGVARLCWAKLWASQHQWMGTVWVSRAQLDEPANVPDVEAGLARYQFVAQLTVALDDVEVML